MSSVYQQFFGSATAIVNQTNAGSNSLVAGIGGGGSNTGPNLQVSTLTVNDSGNITLSYANGGGSINFNFEGENTSSFNIQQGNSVQNSRITNPNGCLQITEQDGISPFTLSYASLQAFGFEVIGGSPPGQASCGLYNSGGKSILYSFTGQPLVVDAPSGVFISSLTVSSINGAEPGGGAGAVIGTSSITTSTINCTADSNSGLFYPADGAVVQYDVGISLTPLTGQYGNTGVVGAWGKEVYQGNPGFAEFATQRLYLVDVTGKATNTTRIENYGNQITIETPSSISLQADTYVTGNLNVSTMTVSSINGGPILPQDPAFNSISTNSISTNSVTTASLNLGLGGFGGPYNWIPITSYTVQGTTYSIPGSRFLQLGQVQVVCLLLPVSVFGGNPTTVNFGALTPALTWGDNNTVWFASSTDYNTASIANLSYQNNGNVTNFSYAAVGGLQNVTLFGIGTK